MRSTRRTWRCKALVRPQPLKGENMRQESMEIYGVYWQSPWQDKGTYESMSTYMDAVRRQDAPNPSRSHHRDLFIPVMNSNFWHDGLSLKSVWFSWLKLLWGLWKRKAGNCLEFLVRSRHCWCAGMLLFKIYWRLFLSQWLEQSSLGHEGPDWNFSQHLNSMQNKTNCLKNLGRATKPVAKECPSFFSLIPSKTQPRSTEAKAWKAGPKEEIDLLYNCNCHLISARFWYAHFFMSLQSHCMGFVRFWCVTKDTFHSSAVPSWPLLLQSLWKDWAACGHPETPKERLNRLIPWSLVLVELVGLSLKKKTMGKGNNAVHKIIGSQGFHFDPWAMWKSKDPPLSARSEARVDLIVWFK